MSLFSFSTMVSGIPQYWLCSAKLLTSSSFCKCKILFFFTDWVSQSSRNRAFCQVTQIISCVFDPINLSKHTKTVEETQFSDTDIEHVEIELLHFYKRWHFHNQDDADTASHRVFLPFSSLCNIVTVSMNPQISLAHEQTKYSTFYSAVLSNMKVKQTFHHQLI